MKIKLTKKSVVKVLAAAFIFWALDFILHLTGIGETNYYYTIKMANALLFAFIWFSIFDLKSQKKRLLFSVVFGTWISFYYLISAYSGLVQFFGIVARYSAPPFVIFNVFLPSFFWWLFHILAFYIGLGIASKIK